MSSSLVASPCSSPPARAAGTRSGSSAGPECSATRTTPSRHTAATVGGLSAAKRQHARLVSSGRDDAAAVCLRDVPGRRMEEASTRWRGQLSSSDDNTAIATRCREGTTSRRRDRRRAEGATGGLGCRALRPRPRPFRRRCQVHVLLVKLMRWRVSAVVEPGTKTFYRIATSFGTSDEPPSRLCQFPNPTHDVPTKTNKIIPSNHPNLSITSPCIYLGR